MTWIQPIIDLIGQVVNKFGTKFAIALAGIGALGYYLYETKPEGPLEVRIALIAGIVVICVGYFISRRKQESEVMQTQLEIEKIKTPMEVKQ
jgi:hypothetical protein